MRKRVAFIVVTTTLLNCAYNLLHYRDYKKTKPIVISAYVDETIDSEEREQFDLFPGIDGFKSAMLYGIAEGGYEIRIITENKKLVAVNRDSLVIMILRDYINRYEEIQNSKGDFEEKWKIVDYDNLGLPITQHEINRIRKPGSGAMWGGSTGCLVGFFPSLVLGRTVGENISEDYGFPTFLTSWGISLVTGALLGEKSFRNNALKAIKESRKPRNVE